jgi:P-type Cu2+ transporter
VSHDPDHGVRDEWRSTDPEPKPPEQAGHSAHAGHAPQAKDDAAHAGHGAHAVHPGETDHGGHAGHVASPGAMEHGEHAKGHDRHAGHSVEMFRTRFWVCLALTIPVLLYAKGLWELFGLEAPDLPGGGMVSFVLATAI